VSLATDKATSDDAGGAEGSHSQAASGSTSPVIGGARPGVGSLVPWKSTGGLPTSPDSAASPGSDLGRSHTVGESYRRRLAGDKVHVRALVWRREWMKLKTAVAATASLVHAVAATAAST